MRYYRGSFASAALEDFGLRKLRHQAVQDAIINLNLHTQPSVLRTAKIVCTSKHN